MKNLISFFKGDIIPFCKTKYLTITLLGLSACTYDQLEEPTICDSNLALVVNQIGNADCGLATGSISVSATGGNGELSFQLNNQTTQATGEFTELASGTYTVSVIDENGCTDIQAIEVQNLDGINIELAAQNSGCGSAQGSILVQATGGIEPYEFSINGNNFQSEDSFTGLAAGSYTIEGLDANGCKISKTIDVTTGVSLRNDIKPIIDQNCALSTCHGGARSPDLRSLNSIINSASRIKARTGNRSMPLGRTLSQTQIDLIACWVDDGALDN